jgi:hypothetical protein
VYSSLKVACMAVAAMLRDGFACGPGGGRNERANPCAHVYPTNMGGEAEVRPSHHAGFLCPKTKIHTMRGRTKHPLGTTLPLNLWVACHPQHVPTKDNQHYVSDPRTHARTPRKNIGTTSRTSRPTHDPTKENSALRLGPQTPLHAPTQ